MLTLEDIERQLSQWESTEDVRRAVDLLLQPNLKIVAHNGVETGNTAGRFLDAYRFRWEHLTRTGIETYGLPVLIGALGRRPKPEMLGVVAAQSEEWFAAFWYDAADRLVGFIVVQRSSEQERHAREEFFDRHMASKAEQ